MRGSNTKPTNTECITDIAHQLGNLLQIISGGAQFASQHLGVNSRAFDYLVEIEKATAKADTLVQQLVAIDSQRLKTIPDDEPFFNDSVESDEGEWGNDTFKINDAIDASSVKDADRSCSNFAHTILIADDDEFSMGLTAQLLEEMGYLALKATSGWRAVELFREHSACINLLLFDVEMRDGNGREAYQAIQALSPGIPIVMCSGYDAARAYKGIQVSNRWLLRKPFRPKELLQVVQQAISVRSGRS